MTLKRKLMQKTILTVPPSSQTQTIEVMATQIMSGAVRLGFAANRDVLIRREEVVELVIPEGEAA